MEWCQPGIRHGLMHSGQPQGLHEHAEGHVDAEGMLAEEFHVGNKAQRYAMTRLSSTAGTAAE